MSSAAHLYLAVASKVAEVLVFNSLFMQLGESSRKSNRNLYKSVTVK